MAAKADSIKTIFFALGANFAIFIAKLIAAMFTGSSAMFAEAMHSIADCGNQVLLLIGMKRAKQPPNADFPLGFGKAIYFWSFMVALILFSVGGLYSLIEGIHKLSHPEPVQRLWIAVLVLGFGVVAESVSMWGCLREVNKIRGNRTLWQWFRESRQSELIVIFGEDLAALIGLVIALIAVLLTWITSNPIYDAMGTVAIGVLLLFVAVFVGVEVKALLIGQSADPLVRDGISAFITEQPEVEKVLNLITLQMGDDVMVAVKAKMKPYAGADFLVDAINRVEARLRAEYPEIRFLFFEPDLVE